MGEVVTFVPPEATPTKQAYQVIQHAITTRRNEFIADFQAGKYGGEFQTYEDTLDREVYKTLGDYRNSNHDAFTKAKEELDAYTTFQLQTFIGERLNVGLSTYGFGIQEGQLVGEKTGEPIVVMIDRGRQTRNAQVDELVQERKISPQVAEEIKQRHDAEVDQFKEIQRVMGDKKALVGTTMISISPPGPGYVHNFYDVFVLKEENGKRHIEARRYASALTAEQSLKQLQRIQPTYGQDRGEQSLIPYLLDTPFVINDPLDLRFNNPDGIHTYIQGDENAMKEADFALVKEVIAEIISVYLQEVFEHPGKDAADRHAEILDALRNKADEAVGNIKILRQQKEQQVIRRGNIHISERQNDIAAQAYAAAIADINHFGAMEVRTVTTGCGKDGSSRKQRGGLAALAAYPLADMTLPGNMSSFSLLDGFLDGEQEWFTCPECKYKADGPIGNQCPGCGLKKEDYGGERCA